MFPLNMPHLLLLSVLTILLSSALLSTSSLVILSVFLVFNFGGWGFRLLSSLRVVAHVGANHASERGADEILNSFRDLNSEVERARKASGVDMRLSICIVVPRTDCGRPISPSPSR
jgi:hypothetical protein